MRSKNSSLTSTTEYININPVKVYKVSFLMSFNGVAVFLSKSFY